ARGHRRVARDARDGRGTHGRRGRRSKTPRQRVGPRGWHRGAGHGNPLLRRVQGADGRRAAPRGAGRWAHRGRGPHRASPPRRHRPALGWRHLGDHRGAPPVPVCGRSTSPRHCSGRGHVQDGPPLSGRGGRLV
ncbi:MAG: hypothetical protein AVDCRST_MAG83-1719, partial [uncultured Arthrobacter sp.]